jgi:DNA primase (bacterial type)
MEKLNCEQAKQIDLVDYLTSLGHQPQKIRNNDYWYLSPLRDERTASFKVNRKLNVWFDHGTGEGGNIIDFGINYHKCSVSDLLDRLSVVGGRPMQTMIQSQPFNTPAGSKAAAGEKKDDTANRIIVLNVRPLSDIALLQYLKQRRIGLDVASQFCSEVDFSLYKKKHTAIGFPNNSGGFELRNSYFKGSSSPKDLTFFDNQKDQLSVFEGHFDFMTFKCLYHHHDEPMSNYLILNSLVFLEKSREILEQHRHGYLYLDRDNPGREATRKILEWNPFKFRDGSKFYNKHEDLNAWYVAQATEQRQSLRTGRKL